MANRVWKRKCKECGKEFVTTDERKLYCDPKICGGRHRQKRHQRKVAGLLKELKKIKKDRGE
jgi:rRNA maturation endonuclease Nob1